MGPPVIEGPLDHTIHGCWGTHFDGWDLSFLDAATNSLATCHSSTLSPALKTRSSAIMNFVPGGQTLAEAEEAHPFNSRKEPLHRFAPVSAIRSHHRMPRRSAAP